MLCSLPSRAGWNKAPLREYIERSMKQAIVIILILTLTALGAGVTSPWLASDAPHRFYQDSLPTLYSIPRASVVVTPALSGQGLSYRLHYMGYPVSGSRVWLVSDSRTRIAQWSTLKRWLLTNSASAVRTSRESGRLVPTIYLPIALPPGIAGVIGEGGQLDIRGHQKITISGVSHIRPNQVSVEGVSQSLFPDLKMEQELVLNLDGTIGEKINVQVDHDTRRTMEPDYNVRLRYTGFDDEVIRSIQMGDVTLAITGPEFVSYSIPSQGLFGAKVEAQVGPLEITTIASKQASSTESADFVGQATMVTDTILDIRPANNYFFGLVPDTMPAPTILSIRIFRDDGTQNPLHTPASWFVPKPGGGFETGTGIWEELQAGPGMHYVLEDSARVIRFLSPVNANHMIAVWAVIAAGDTLGTFTEDDKNLLLIKDSNPTVNHPTWQYMLRNRYYLGANNIVRESFSCDIFLDTPGEDPVSSQDGVPFLALLGLDTNADGSMVDETATMDWDNGFIIFPDNRPFTSSVLNVQNPSVYNEKNPPISKSVYFLRVSFRAASTTYSLGRMGLVPGSERVTLTVAGQTIPLVRDQDYTIIYEIGLLSLMGERAEQALDPANTLRVTFEYLPFFARMSKTLFGTRMKYQIGRLSWVGATIMYESASTPEDRPRPGEEAYNTLVMDLDARFEARPEFLTDMVNAIPLVRTEAESMVMLSGEVAMSMPGGESVAYIDDMEGSQSTYPMGQSRLAWSYASLPIEGRETLAGRLRWWNWERRWRMGDIVPGLTGTNASEDVSRSVLQLYFQPEMGTPDSWGGIMRSLDRYGSDFSSRTHISLYVRATGAARNASLYLDLGERMDEDSYWPERVGDQIIMRANGILDTEDKNGDGILSSDEDTGYDGLFSSEEPGYHPTENPDPNQDDYHYDSNDPVEVRFNRINGMERNNRLDTEDLNRNGVLDRTNTFFRVQIPLDNPDYIVHGPNEYGWMLISVPLNDSLMVTVPDIVTGVPTWSKIVYARLWMDGFTQADTLEIYDLGIVGNRWERREISLTDSTSLPILPWEEFTVSVVNNRENQEYIDDPPPGIDPGKDDYGNIKLEQSLSLSCRNLQPGHQGLARQNFYSGADYTGYESFRILVRGNVNHGEAFFQIGRDSLNYYELRVPLQQGWQVLDIPMQELVNLKLLRENQGQEFVSSGNLSVRGSPNLANVLSLALGVRNSGGPPLTAEVWINDITLRSRYMDEGFAHRVTGQVNFADLLTVKGDYRMVGADFHSLGSNTGTGRTTTRYSANTTLNLDRFSPPLWGWSLPATYAWSRNLSEPRFQSNTDIRIEGEDSWFQRTDNTTWDTSVQWRKTNRSEGLVGRYFLDPWTVRHTMGEQRGLAPTSRDSVETERFTVGYNLSPGRMRLFRLPILEDFRLRPTRIGFNVRFQRGRDVRWDLAQQDTVRTRNNTQRELLTDGSLGFNFWKGNTLSYSLGVRRDLYYPWTPEGFNVNVGREVSRSQSVSAAQDINFWSYLMPRVSYDANYTFGRLSPHTPGADTLSLPDVGISTNLRYTFRLGLAHAMRRVSRLRDERRDEEATPGSPRWVLMKMERWANNITDPTLNLSFTNATSYKSLESLPPWQYQFGLQDELDDLEPYNRTEGESMQLGGGVRPVSAMTIRAEYGNSTSRSYYSGFWNRQNTVTWPSLTMSWSGLERLKPFAFLRTGTLSSGYRLETVNASRIEGEEEIPVSETVSRRYSPLVSINVTLKNKVQINLTENLTLTENRNFTGTSAVTQGTSQSTQFGVSYAFRAPQGVSIPLPLLNRIRLRFQSELTTGIKVSRSLSKSEIIRDIGEDILQTDRTDWRIEPYASYDFGTVQAGMTALYGWKKDRVNNRYDQTDVGLNIWVRINF